MNNILIVGFGSAAKRHIENLFNQKKDYFFFILSRKKKIKDAFLKKIQFKQIKLITDIKKVEIKYSFICTGSNEHFKYINILQKYNHDIFVEKPLDNSLKNLKKLNNIIDNYHKKIFVGYNLLFHKTIKKFKKLNIKKEKIFKISSKVGYFLPFWRENIDYKKSVTAQKKMGGGVLLELSHEINYLLFLFGRPTWTSSFLSKMSNLKINVEDNAFIILGYKKFICFLEMDLISKDYTRYSKIDTAMNSYLLDLKENKIIKYTSNKKTNILFNNFVEVNNSYLNQLNFFQTSSVKKTKKFTKLAIDTLKVIEAIKKSSIQNGTRKIINY